MKRTKFATKVKKESQRWHLSKPKRSKPKKGYRILIADSLKPIMKQIENNPPNIPGFSIARMEYLLHLIMSHKRKKHQGSYSILNMQYMNNIVPQAGQYIQFLKREGIIEYKNYSAARNSRLYRLAEESRVEFRTITDQSLIRRIEKARKEKSKQNSKKYPHLNKFIHRVEIEYDNAIKAVEQKYQQTNDKAKAEHQRTYALAEIEKIQAKEIFIKFSQTERRLHTNFVRLPSYLLAYLRIDGYPLHEMDISNSQPFFVIALFRPTPEIEQVIREYLGESYIMYIKSLKAFEREDVKRYISLVTSGEFYEYMTKKFQDHGIPVSDRKEIKELLFTTVFFGNVYAHKFKKDGKLTKGAKAARLFRKEFPTVYRLFYRIKKEEKNRLAILLQRIEAYTMLECVVKRIEQEIPDMPILTRHDSILPFYHKFSITENHLTKTQEIMVNTIHQVIGVRPQGRMRKYVDRTFLFNESQTLTRNLYT